MSFYEFLRLAISIAFGVLLVTISAGLLGRFLFFQPDPDIEAAKAASGQRQSQRADISGG